MQHRTIVAGVYFLFKDGKLTYIGKSKDVDKRIDQHDGNGREFDLAITAAVPIAMLDMVEKTLIEAFRPEQNRRHVQRVETPIFMEPARVVVPNTLEMPNGDTISFARAKSFAVNYGLSPEFALAIQNGDLKCAVQARLRSSNSRSGWAERKVLNTQAFKAWLEEARKRNLESLGL